MKAPLMTVVAIAPLLAPLSAKDKAGESAKRLNDAATKQSSNQAH